MQSRGGILLQGRRGSQGLRRRVWLPLHIAACLLAPLPKQPVGPNACKHCLTIRGVRMHSTKRSARTCACTRCMCSTAPESTRLCVHEAPTHARANAHTPLIPLLFCRACIAEHTLLEWLDTKRHNLSTLRAETPRHNQTQEFTVKQNSCIHM